MPEWALTPYIRGSCLSQPNTNLNNSKINANYNDAEKNEFGAGVCRVDQRHGYSYGRGFHRKREYECDSPDAGSACVERFPCPSPYINRLLLCNSINGEPLQSFVVYADGRFLPRCYATICLFFSISIVISTYTEYV